MEGYVDFPIGLFKGEHVNLSQTVWKFTGSWTLRRQSVRPWRLPFWREHLYTIVPAADAIRGHKSAHSFATGPVIAEPFISPLMLTITPALSTPQITTQSSGLDHLDVVIYSVLVDRFRLGIVQPRKMEEKHHGRTLLSK